MNHDEIDIQGMNERRDKVGRKGRKSSLLAELGYTGSAGPVPSRSTVRPRRRLITMQEEMTD